MVIVENKKSRGRPRAFDREAALQRAMKVFWAAGYEGTSVPMLTDAMGISAQSLYAAYGSKDALYREAIDLYRTTIGGFGMHALENADAVEAIARLLRDAAVVFSSAKTHPGCMITTAPAGISDDPLTLYGRDLRRQSMRQVELRLERGVQEGQLSADLDCAAWARYVAGVVQGLSVQARDGETREGLLSMVEIAVQSLDRMRA